MVPITSRTRRRLPALPDPAHCLTPAWHSDDRTCSLPPLCLLKPVPFGLFYHFCPMVGRYIGPLRPPRSPRSCGAGRNVHFLTLSLISLPYAATSTPWPRLSTLFGSLLSLCQIQHWGVLSQLSLTTARHLTNHTR